MNKRILLLALILPMFFACKTKKYSRNNKEIEKAANKANPNIPSYTTLNYIETFKAVAIEEMNTYGIPASITLAQGIIESGSGNSSLAKYANNHFGIKCTSEWKGKAYYKDDDNTNDCFRVYKDARESYKDHSEFLKRKRYSFLFELDKNDYKNWANGLKQAGYATNPRYPAMLISMIEKYQLYQYDQSESEKEKLKREDKIFTEINANIPQEKKKFTPVATPPSKQVITTPADTSAPVKTAVIGTVMPATLAEKVYTVQKGDTLYNLSKRFNISIEDIKTLNSLTEEGIKIGQKLVLVK
ncbi:Flagellum-specific peptidoglycan hydrolase FlgJ [Pedobacter steynii]|uniref:Peptidoglycan hydrolase n=1 Tax=Pedobacter steynii TaxID=430522 RepID=A0A1H0EEE6_9SPHI|nr:glucosaminidase domain-containing protein [Pedobacter steynii]NQX41992.1 glucosaminidase domain-containing protein [Pedobacter steynii]SDN80681.1 Flagellum-specific peptidoglycan hydrolase FlgJ [Pedobacter steynii]